MNLDDIVALAASHRPSPLELTRARRAARRVQQDYDAAVAKGYEPVGDVDLHDPLIANIDESTRITRAAQLAKLGTARWHAQTGAVTWSDEMSMIFGYAPGTVRPTSGTFLRTIHPDDAAQARSGAENAWSRCVPTELVFRIIRPDGLTRYVQCHLEILTDAGQPSGIIATGEDVTALELARQERVRLATRADMLCPDPAAADLVTGLPTRAYFTDEVDRARRTGRGTVLVVTTETATRLPGDLRDDDRDRLAADIAAVLREAVGTDATTACGLAGPNQMGVLLRGARPESTTSITERILDRFRQHLFLVSHRSLRLNTWAGAVSFEAGTPATGFDLLVDAEHAAREARRNGHSALTLDQPASQERRLERCRTSIRNTVAAGRFALYAQPILDLQLNQVTRHEILLRVRNETGEPLAPWAFLDTAEQVGEISGVDGWVVERAMELVGQGSQTSHYQVNISGRSLAEPELLDTVSQAMRQHGVDPSCITFEITETALIENRNEALAFAHGVRRLGCQLALDDFGTGYAALAYLKYLPVDLVKIDGEFIVNLCNSPSDQALVSHLVELCHTLGIRVAAEYVQDAATIAMLRGYGVDFAQGYEIGRPEPLASSLHQKSQSIELELHLPHLRTAMG